jgi:Protein of unknown function (DUF2950)
VDSAVAEERAVVVGGDSAMTGTLGTICTALLFGLAAPSIAQERFDSPEAAATAIIEAADNHDTARLSAILGSQAKGILTSGNPTQDTSEQTEFSSLARAKHRLEISAMNPNRAVLCIGDEDWPFPVPIVRTNGKWSFDASQTKMEMRARHIGADELDAIEICHGYVEAQQKYASDAHGKDGMHEYAAHLMSSPGQHDGLYWEGANDPLVPEGFAQAERDGTGREHAKPYHGYYFRILEKQGSDAPGGAHIYIVKNKLIGGFGLVAWPAEYGVTGIHTFIVNQSGVVFQKDIALVPGQAAITVTSFDPDHSWKPVD